MIDEEKEVALQATFKAISDPVRREILELLKKGPMTAGDIVSNFSITGAAISRHLSVLRDADLIRDRRDGKYIWYELNTSVLEDAMVFLTALMGKGEKE